MANFLRGVVVVIVLVGGITLAVTLFSRSTSRNAAGEITMPPDWPVSEITVPAGAADVHFNHDLRSLGDTGREVLRRMPDRYQGRGEPFQGPWLLYFNDPSPVSTVFDHFEQPLIAAGYVKGAGREEAQIAQYGLADRSYTSADGSLNLQVRYWAIPPKAEGAGNQPQHWCVMIMKQ